MNLKDGICAKLNVTCMIIAENGKAFVGQNLCQTPQEKCPRVCGDGYEKCKDICHQLGHAEEMAVMEMLKGLAWGGTAHLFGHYYACDNCKKILMEAGVKYIEYHTSKEEYFQST